MNLFIMALETNPPTGHQYIPSFLKGFQFIKLRPQSFLK